MTGEARSMTGEVRGVTGEVRSMAGEVRGVTGEMRGVTGGDARHGRGVCALNRFSGGARRARITVPEVSNGSKS